jgi:pyruvate dehydrogenase (quinone)
MAATAADRMVESLLEWGVDIVFGLPGDGINGIMESLRQRQDRIRFVQVRHEETAALMACGYAKLTGRLGVCLATSGPGGIHLLMWARFLALRSAWQSCFWCMVPRKINSQAR